MNEDTTETERLLEQGHQGHPDDPTPVIQDTSVIFRISVGPLTHQLAVDRLLLAGDYLTLYEHVQLRLERACQEIEARPEYDNWLKNGP